MSQENNFIPSQESYKNLRPFPLFMKTNFPFIENTFESLDVYGLLCKVVEYLNNVIENENIVTNNQQAVYNAFVELNDYVSHYFDNLDVQEEINNKLDDMVEDGTLQEIITAYIQMSAIWCFNSVSDMLTSTNLINGSFARTLGYYNKNDGGGAIYSIQDESTEYKHYEELENGLYAVLLGSNVNVKQLGAKGNGIDDDTNIFNEAVTKYDHIEIPESSNYYIITHVHVPSNKTLKGTGGKLKVKDNYAVDSSVSYYVLDNIDENNVIFDSIEIHGNSEHNTSFNVCDSITAMGNNTKVINCKIYDSIDSGIMFSQVKNGLCKNNYIDTTSDCGIYVNSGTLSYLENNIISDNIICNAGTSGIACKRYCSDIILTNNIIYDSRFGITMEQASTETDFSTQIPITNNLIKNTSESGIIIRGGKNHLVSSNTILNCLPSIEVSSCTNSTISNNIIETTKNGSGTYKGEIRVVVRNASYPTEKLNIIGNTIKSVDECISFYNLVSANYDSINVANNILTTSNDYVLRCYNGILYNSSISNNISPTSKRIMISSNVDSSDVIVSNNNNITVQCQNIIQPALIISAHADSSAANESKRIFNTYRTDTQKNSTRYKKGDIVFSNATTGTICYIASADGLGSDVLIPLITLS